ncbi:MAG: MFS transporter [Alphaproteobacteria bacterium]|nr:MAG: MFS transporter [Alphaproteobacteria bacterium]
MTSAVTVGDFRQDMKVLGLISTGHLLSHFYFLALPPLFVFMRADLGLSFTELGLMMALLYAVTAVAQIPVGFLVDRVGARVVLATGLFLMSACFVLVGLSPAMGQALAGLGLPFDATFGLMLLWLALAGVGNSVFHPADYAILNASINPARMGRAFSIHTFFGHLGFALAPATMLFLAALTDWKMALVIAGLIGIATMFAMVSQWNSLHDDALLPGKEKSDTPAMDLETDTPGPAKAGPTTKEGLALLFSAPMLLFFLFFAALGMTASGVQAFLVVALVGLDVAPLEIAAYALTSYLFASVAGILLGGEIADRTKRHDLTAVIAFVITGAVMLSMTLFKPGAILLCAVMVIAGLCQGIIRPARDMMLRAASPKGSTGKVFGFVSAGIAAGAAVSPALFGVIMDANKPAWVFYLLAFFMVIAIISITMPKPKHR